MCVSVSATKTFVPVYQPTLDINRTNAEIKIDGDLDDIGWGLAGRADNFVERFPGDMTEPEVETKAYITYDDENLYVAFVCYDDPATIRATMTQRDQYYGDDQVGILVDTYGDASWAYQLFVNPYGIQKDQLWSTIIGEDRGYDLIWESAAKVTDSGYQVELAVPFASMRFPNKDTQSWKVDFWRNRPRESYTQYSWAAYDRNEQCYPCQWGTVSGIENVQSGKGVELMPTVIANQSGALSDHGNPDSPFDNDDVTGEMSLGGKYAVNSNITIEAAYNPDFSQIEADAAQIDVNSTIALFYPERRPFFQEGSDIFRTLFNSFYTRTVNDPVFTAKMTGRMDGYTIGFLSARDENTPYSIPLVEGTITLNAFNSTANVLRASRAFGEDSRVGLLLSDRRYDGGGSGSIAALDADIRLSRNYRFDGQWIASHTAEPEDHSRTWFFGEDKPDNSADALAQMMGGDTFDGGKHTVAFDGESYLGHAFISRLRRNSRSWNFNIDFNQVSPSYRTQIGYDPLMNYRNFSIFNAYHIRPESGLFERITPRLYASGRWHFDGVNQNEIINFNVDGQMRFAQINIGTSYGTHNETYGGVRYSDLWDVNLNFNTRPSDRVGFGFHASLGRGIARFAQAKGDEKSFNFYFDLKPIDRLIIEPNFDYSRMDISGEKLYSGYITRTRVRFQASRRLSVRLVAQYNNFRDSWDIDPLLTYRLSSFSVFYIGSTYDYNHFQENPGTPNDPTDPYRPASWELSSRQFFMKFQYLIRI
jgi:hypothetical protein